VAHDFIASFQLFTLVYKQNSTELTTENIRTEPELNPNFLHLWRTRTEPYICWNPNRTEP